MQIKDIDLRGNQQVEKLNDSLEIQLVDFYETHDTQQPRNYQIAIFGIDAQSKSYCIKVNGFKPFFYIEMKGFTFETFKQEFLNLTIPGRFFDLNVERATFNTKTNKNMIEKVKFKIFNGYHPNKTTFAKISFNKKYDYDAVKNYLSGNKWNNTPGKAIIINGTKHKCLLYESNIPPLIRFLHQKNIKSTGWINIDKEKYCEVNKYFMWSNCQYELEVDFNNINPSSKINIGPLLIASFDLECISNDNGFPQFSRINDKVVQIGTTVEMFGNSKWSYKYIVTLGECDDIENCKVVKCETESELLLEWSNFIKTLDPDIITGYNILGFDYEYLYERAKIHNIEKEFCSFSRIKNLLTGKENNYQMYKKLFIEKKLSSSAMGDNLLKSINVTGRINLDLLKYVRDSGDKLSSYKLDNVSKHYGLTQGKNDMPYHEIFRIFRENGSAKEIKNVADYCIQDCKLCNQLINKLSVIENCIGMAGTCHVPLSYLFSRGQGIKTYSLVIKECTKLGYIVPVKEKKSPGGFKGATVLSANSGAHFYPVSALDFASLYPSSMISHNICISSKIDHDYIVTNKLKNNEFRKIEWEEEMTKDDVLKHFIDYRYIEHVLNEKDLLYILHNEQYMKDVVMKDNNIKNKIKSIMIKKIQQKNVNFLNKININLNDLKLKNEKDNSKKTLTYNLNIYITKRHFYIQPKKNNSIIDENDRAVLPKILQQLLNKRNDTKKLKAKFKTSDPFKSKIYDGLQLAYKVTANSIYGQLGAPTGNFSNLDVAASVTTTGRQLLELAQNFILKHYNGSKAIYGDSVTKDTPVLLKNNTTNQIEIKQIDDLFTIDNNIQSYQNFKPFDTFLSNRIDKEQNTSKKYQIWTSNGWSNIKRVIRHKCNKKIYSINTHSSYVQVTEDHSLLSENLNKIKPKNCDIGMKLYQYPLNEFKMNENIKIKLDIAYVFGFFSNNGFIKHNNWFIESHSLKQLEKIKNILEKNENIKFKIIFINKNKGLYKLFPLSYNKNFINKYKSLSNNIPIFILNANKKIKQNFLIGLFNAKNGNCNLNHNLQFINNNQLFTAKLSFLLKSLRYNINVINKNNKFILNTFNNYVANTNTLKFKNDISKNYINDFVYDIEIFESHHNFQAGIGNIIVKNTDSCFIKFELKNHKNDCIFHKNNIKKRKDMYHNIKNEIIKKMELNDETFLHSYKATAMMFKTDFQLYEKCNCELIEDLMSENALQKSIDLACEADEIVTDLLPDMKQTINGKKIGCQQLEYEKTYQPYILFSKKRYVGKLYEFNTNQNTGWYLDYKGIILKRRDNCGILKIIYKGCLNHIMNGEIEQSFDFLQKSLNDLFNNHTLQKFSIENFIISKTLKSLDKYKPDKKTGNVHVAHVILAKRVAKRDPGNAFQTNERVQYCFIQKKGKNLLQGEMIETPSFIKNNNLKLDYTYYIQKQLKNPIEQLFEYIDYDKVKKIFEKILNKGMMEKKGLQSIQTFFKKIDLNNLSDSDDELLYLPKPKRKRKRI